MKFKNSLIFDSFLLISRITISYTEACSQSEYLTIIFILQNHIENHLILSQQGCRPSWLKSDDILQGYVKPANSLINRT